MNKLSKNTNTKKKEMVWYFMKRFFLICFLIFLFALLILLSLFENEEEKQYEVSIIENENSENNIADNSTIVETDASDKKVSYNATLIINKYYTDCGHLITSAVEVPYDMINLTEEEIENEYPDWEVISFSESKVSLYREFDGICDEHYEVGINDGYIIVYNINEENEKSVYENTNITTDYLPEEDISDLESGISIEGIENLNSLLEDFE